MDDEGEQRGQDQPPDYDDLMASDEQIPEGD